MTGTDLCVNKPHKSRSYLNHLVQVLTINSTTTVPSSVNRRPAPRNMCQMVGVQSANYIIIVTLAAGDSSGLNTNNGNLHKAIEINPKKLKRCVRCLQRHWTSELGNIPTK
jgi:hypothetical protein